MTPIHYIVVATDFSPGATAALDRAVQLARTHGASLRLLHVFDVSTGHSLRGVFDPQRLALDAPPDVQFQRRLTELATSLAAQTGLQVEARFTVGQAASAISAFVSAHATALLVMASRSEPGMLGVGRTASSVLRWPTCPVLVVRVGQVRPYARALTAVDLSPLALRAADFAMALFPAIQHYLLLAYTPGLEGALGRQAVLPESSAATGDVMHTHAGQELESLARKLSERTQLPVLSEVINDVPAGAIVERAAALHVDCVVVGHHGPRAGAEGQMGSMAQHILQHTLRDVLVVP